jgi:hypothetical protein
MNFVYPPRPPTLHGPREIFRVTLRAAEPRTIDFYLWLSLVKILSKIRVVLTSLEAKILTLVPRSTRRQILEI